MEILESVKMEKWIDGEVEIWLEVKMGKEKGKRYWKMERGSGKRERGMGKGKREWEMEKGSGSGKR